MQHEALEAQGTKIRVLANKTENATFGQVGTTVTVTLAAHGLAAGDRIEVLTATDSDTAVGRFTVSGITSNTFSYTADGEDTVAAGSAITFKKFLDVEAKTFNGPGGSASVIDSTTLSSTAKRKKMGLMDNGQLGFTVFYNTSHPAHKELMEARAARRRLLVEMAFTDSPTTYWAFGVYVLTVPVTGNVDGLIESAVNTEIDGDIEAYTD